MLNYQGKSQPGFRSKYKECIKSCSKSRSSKLHIFLYDLRNKQSPRSAVGWLNAISSAEKKPNDSFHWKKIFNQLKKQEEIEDEDVVAIATEFSCENDDTEKIILKRIQWI